MIFVPLIYTCALIYIGMQEADSLAYVTTAFHWIPVISPMSTIYFVKEYRTAVLKTFKIHAASTTHPSAGVNTSSVQPDRFFSLAPASSNERHAEQ